MDPAEKEKAKPYLRDMDFAFFAVKLGWSRAEYEAMTPVQRLFVLKEIERETVRSSELDQSVAEIAMANAGRKKGKKHRKLWKRRRRKAAAPVDADEASLLRQAFRSRAKSGKDKVKGGGAGDGR